MPSFAALGRFFGSAASNAAGYAAGSATARTLDPALQEVTNTAWEQFAIVPPDALTLAAGVAQGQVPAATAYAWAKQTGFDKAQMDALVNIANVGPPLASALTLLRRGVWTPADYRTALNREAIEQQWYPGLLTLKDVWLTPEQLAVMVQRGIVANDNLLPVGPPSAVGRVPPMPMISIDPIAEAAGAGIDADRLAGMARIIGLPASPDLAARMVFRNIIDRVDFDRAISEGNTRNEWAPFLFDGFRQILTAHDWVELNLRGYITKDEMYAGTGLHGMSTADSDHLFSVLGRPLAVHQITTGLARGGVFQPIPGEIQDPYEASVHEANIKPSYYDLAIANKYTLPSAFVLKALATAGDLTQDETNTLLLQIGWPPDLAAKVSAVWGAAKSAPANKHVTSSQTTLVTAARKAYVGGAANAQQTRDALTAASVAPAQQDALLKLWDAQRVLEALPTPTAP